MGAAKNRWVCTPRQRGPSGWSSAACHGAVGVAKCREPPTSFPPIHRVPALNSTLRRWIVLAVKLSIVAAVLWLVRGTIEQSWNYLVEHPRRLHPPWLALSGGACLLERIGYDPLIIHPDTQTTEGEVSDGMLRSEEGVAQEAPGANSNTNTGVHS